MRAPAGGAGLGKKDRELQNCANWLFSRQRYWGEPFPIVWQTERHRFDSPKSEPAPSFRPPSTISSQPATGRGPPLAKGHRNGCDNTPIHHEAGRCGPRRAFRFPSLGLIEGAEAPCG